jgi:hypothetical protein
MAIGTVITIVESDSQRGYLIKFKLEKASDTWDGVTSKKPFAMPFSIDQNGTVCLQESLIGRVNCCLYGLLCNYYLFYISLVLVTEQ